MGWTFNTTNPDAPTDGPQITAVAATMTALALTTVMLRVYVRWGMLNAFGTGKLTERPASVPYNRHLGLEIINAELPS